MRRSLGAVFLLAAVTAGLGCARSERPTDTLVVGIESMPNDLDPRFATDAASSRIDDLVFRSLTRFDEHRDHVPDLATDWRLESPLLVRFELRRDARFSDGTPLTAADVRATYDSILDPKTASPKREELAFLDAIEAPDEHTVRFRLKAPFAPFLEATTVGILPEALLRATTERIFVGSGTYRIAESAADQEIRLVARPDHPGIREIRFRVIPDDTVRALELRKGTLDLVQNAVEPDNVAWLAESPSLCVRRRPGTTFQYLGLNFRDRRLLDTRVRQAIAHAIDRDALVRHLLGGAARPATGLLSPEHWAYQANVPRHAFDPARAKRLLDEAGFADPDGDGPAVRLRFSYKTSTLDSRRRMGEAMQAMLGAVGIGLDVRSFEWGTFYDDIRRGNFELYSLAWVGVNDPDFHFGLLASSMTPPRGNNRGAYANPDVDRLVALGRETLEPAERRRIYSEVQRRAAEDLPFIPLWWTDNVVVQTKRLCGFTPGADGSLASLASSWLAAPDVTPPGGVSRCGCGSGT